MNIEDRELQELMAAMKDLAGAIGGLSQKIEAKGRCGNRPVHKFEDRFRSVFDLYEKGLSLDEISQKLNLDKGEVQLIFNISRKI
jgi:DNA-binding NarL/FixJ family response regulator